MKNEIEVWSSEYELRQFIDTARRWPIKGVLQDRTEKRPYSIFTEDLKNARINFELFSNQLNKKLTDNKNWKAIGIDMEHRFLQMLNQYIDWYSENKEETEIFGSYNPYELMFSIIESTKKEILKYFPGLSHPENDNTFNLKKIENELRNKPTITDKLDYWNEIKIKYIDDPLIKTEGRNLFDNSNYYKRLAELFGKDYEVVSSLLIPKHIYNEHFKDGLNDPEFTYWFLKYNAKVYFESIYLGSYLDNKLGSPIAKQHIAAKLKKLNTLELKAGELLLNGEVDIDSPYYNSEYAQEIEFLRIKDNYYVKNTLPEVHSVVNTTVELYAKHVYLKDFLESKLKVLEAAHDKSQTIQKKYKKHPTGLDLIRLPGAILKQYSISCEYNYINISGFGKIPVPLFAILGVEHNNIDIQSIPLKDYAMGFLKGYNSNLIPFIDNNDTRKEVILHEGIFKGGKGFKESHTGKSIEYKPESMFESGLFEGKRYKAWEIIFETPSAFIRHFEPPQSQKTKSPKNITENTMLDDKNSTVQDPDSFVPDELLFSKENYQIEINEWNKHHNDNLAKWLKNGQMVEIEKWLFVSTHLLQVQKRIHNYLLGLIDYVSISIADTHDTIKLNCQQKAQEIESLLDSSFQYSNNIQITAPFNSLCPKIVKQPIYLIEAFLKYRDDLPENQKIYYRYNYLSVRLGFGKANFQNYRNDLNNSIKAAEKNKPLIKSMFQFMEQFIVELSSFSKPIFNYMASPLFRLLFEEVIKFKGNYTVLVGSSLSKYIINIEENLKLLDPITSELYPSLDKEQTNIISGKVETQNSDNLNQSEGAKLTAEIAGLFAYFLAEAKLIQGTREEIAKQAIKLLKCEYALATVLGRLNTTYSKNSDKVLSYDNVKAVIPFLKPFKPAHKLANETLMSYQIT